MSKIIVLASSSPRRQEILRNLGVNFEIARSNYKEILDHAKSPYELASYTALQKCKSIPKTYKTNNIVVGADTIVVYKGVLEKPADPQEAFQMLKTLSNNVHEVVTGIGIMDYGRGIYVSDYEVTRVYFRKLNNKEIHKYISTGEPMDKAGAYGIQGKASLFIKRIEGDYFNVVGLPVYKLGLMLKKYFNYSIL